MGTATHSRTNFYFTMFIVNLLSIGTGNTYSWTSPTLPFLMSPKSFLQIDQNAASWIASLYLLGGVVSPLFAGSILQTIGFKRTFFLCNILLLTAWLVLASTWSVYMLYFGRFMHGITIGVIFLTFPLYVAETAEDNLRGAFNSIPLIFRCVGILMEFAVGPFVSYYQLILANMVAPILYLIGCFWMPESPYYLITNGKKEDAVSTVAWLRGIHFDDAEIITNQIQKFIERNQDEKKSLKDLSSTKGNIKGLLITSILLSLQQLSGVTAMGAYAQQLFSLTGSDISPSTSAIIYGSVYLLGSAAGPFVAKRYGFRKPLIFFGVIQFIAEFFLGMYVFYYTNGFDVSMYTWCPLLCVILYAGSFNIASGPMPWGIMGEIFPPNFKGTASSVSTSVCFTSAFLTTKYFPILSEILHPYVVFWMFASANILSSVFTVFFVPNTKGLSLEQIQNKLNKKDNTDDINVNVYI